MPRRFWISPEGQRPEERISHGAFDTLAESVASAHDAGDLTDQEVLKMLGENPLLEEAAYRRAMQNSGEL